MLELVNNPIGRAQSRNRLFSARTRDTQLTKPNEDSQVRRSVYKFRKQPSSNMRMTNFRPKL